MKRLTSCFAAMFVISVFSVAHGQTFTVLHPFSGGADGDTPNAGLALIDSTLYGTTVWAGLYKIGTDGGGFSVLHSFSVAGPNGNLAAGDSTLYGATCYGSSYSGFGSIYKLDAGGSGFLEVQPFTSTTGYPTGGVTLANSTLFGATNGISFGTNGNIYKINTNLTGFGILHTFTGTGGSNPSSGVACSGSTVYGTTMYGGNGYVAGHVTSGYGTIYKLNADNGDYSLLHAFSGSDGANPYGIPTLVGSTLYGTTGNGGTSGLGTIFKVDTIDDSFSVLHTFTGGSSDGRFPSSNASSLTLRDSTFYGTTQYGGALDLGMVFKMDMDGGNFEILHSFTGIDGMYPDGGLLIDGSTLYGACKSGGIGGKGVLFSLSIPEPSSFVLLGIGAATLAAFARGRRRRAKQRGA
jgi:uncharacterized repeat protein (TIGR03803 family)